MQPDAKTAAILGFFNVFNTFVERFGWPGVILCGTGWFVVEYASQEQKRKIVDMYVLGQGTPYHILLLAVLAIVVLLAQSRLHSNKMREMKARNEVVEMEKNRFFDQLQDANKTLANMAESRAEAKKASSGRK